MKFRILATLAFLVMCVIFAITGALSAPAAVALAFLASASLTPVSLFSGRLAACPTAFDALRVATEYLPDTIYRKASQTNFFTGYIQKDEYPRNQGVNPSVFVIQNTEPYSNAEAWVDITLTNNVVSNMCTPSYVDVDVGYQETTYSPRKFGLAGPIICRESLTFTHDPGLFIRQYENELVKRAKRTWEFELRNQNLNMAAKGIANTSFSISQPNTAFTQNAATSQLTQDMLDTTAQYLIEAGATDADQEWVELGPDGPVFPLYIGIGAAQALTTNQAERRIDERFADMGKGPNAELMKRLGAMRMIRNFRIVPVVLPPRFTFTNGIGYQQVNTYEQVSTTEGTAARISTAYKNARFEAAIVPHPMAFMSSVVRPDSAGLDWSPINYMGEWVWLTGGNLISSTYCFDPMKNYGRHFAEFMYAPKPIFPEFTVALMYKLCPNDITQAPCLD